ncbi:MAG TPA: aspartate aminotransferase family protein [Elusimicrobia bacterium]|nr:aspartate aminotransferase family protein [Elusimicrobiota bacterium]
MRTHAVEAELDYPKIVVPPPGPKAREVIKRDKRWTSTSYIKEYPLVVSHGKGPWVADIDGNRYLDFMAGIAVASTGYSHPKVVRAIQESASRFLHICGTDFYFEGFAELAERLARLAPGQSKKRTFLTNSGAEAIDGAIKLVRQSTGRPGLISFNGAFHGRTYGAMSLTSSKAKQKAGFGPLLPCVHHMPFGYCYRCAYGLTHPACRLRCVSEIEDGLFRRDLSPKEVAAIFVEPIQGEGGYILPPPGYLKALRELCDRNGILLVFDEVQSGIGRTGKMFAAELYGVEPDVLCVGKGIASGMPLGAIVAKESIMKWDVGSHGSTYGGNPVCCAAALATLDVVENELLGHVRKTGEALLLGLKRLQSKHECIGDVRGVGFMVGVEFVKDRESRAPAQSLVHELTQRAFRKGLLLLSCGQSVIRIAPPLVLTEKDIETGLQVLDECLTELT